MIRNIFIYISVILSFTISVSNIFEPSSTERIISQRTLNMFSFLVPQQRLNV